MYEEPFVITSAELGLILSWSKNRDFQKKTLNPRIETAETLASYKNSSNQRSLILVNDFHEWKWLDEKGKNKKQYLIKVANQPIFGVGGLYYVWKDPETEKLISTVSIVTTEANELMHEIHNTKYIMPFLLTKQNQYRWLDDLPLNDFFSEL